MGPATIASDLSAVANAMGAHQLVSSGYSWLALIGLQFAIQTDRRRL